MRKWGYKLFSIVLCALVLGASAGPLFAQKQFKYLPKVLKSAPKTNIPYAVNPKLPPAVRAQFAMPLVRPNVTPHVERAVATQAITPVQAQSLVTPAVPAPQTAPALPTIPTPPTTAVEDTGTNLTGTQALAQYFPTWRQELGGMFSKEQLDAVEKAFAETDEWMFVRGEDGELKIRNKDEWDYEARFLTIVKDSGVEFTEQQIRKLIGRKGTRGKTLNAFFVRMNGTGFACAKKTSPRMAIFKDSKRISQAQMTEKELQELRLGVRLNTLRKHPAIKAFRASNRRLEPKKTVEYYLRLAQQYPNRPRSTIYKEGKPLSREEMTGAEWQEIQVGQGLHYHRNDPRVQAYFNQNRMLAERKTPEEYVALARQYDRKPRSDISRNGHTLTREEMTPEEIQEVRIGRGLANYRNHPAVIAYMKENRLKAENQTLEQLYTALITHIKYYGHYPMYKESSLPISIYYRLRRHQSTMTDGKYADPYLQKIYELKQWSERVKRGEVDWDKFPGLFKKHRRTIGEMREQGILPQKEVAQELEQLSTEEQQAIEQMADNMLTLWEDFEGVWWKQNRQHIVMTPQTQIAFNTVLSTVRNQVPGASNINISNVLEQLNSMQLGQDGPDYYRVIYRGDNPRIPRAEDFHNVLETQGIAQSDAANAYKLNSPHIDLDGDEEMVYNLIIRQGVTDRVTDKEMAAVIDALTPAGWEVRIGAHELLSEIKQGKVHIHIEQVVPTTEEDALDTSNVLRVDLRALTQGKNPQQIAKTLRYLFSKYLKEDGHQALNNIQKAF